MRLFELTDADPLDVRLVAVLSQITGDLKKNPDREWTVPKLLSFMRKNNINLGDDSGEMLRSLVTKPPLNNFISNVQGDKVIFSGGEGPEGEADPMKKKDIVKGMAKSALKRG